MSEIRSIIIDDEAANRHVLESLIDRNCPGITVVGTASSAQEGHRLILQKQPDLVFLDVKMPVKTGFDLLRMFEEIPFHVVFVTAFDEFAIQAFEFNAVDYLLKPIDPDKLIRSAEKAARSIRLNDRADVVHFIRSMDEKNQLLKRISLHKKDKVVMVDIDQICFIQASGNYCEVTTRDNQRLVSAKTLAEYESLLEPYPGFLRVSKSTLINIRYVLEYTKGSLCFVTVLNSPHEIEVSRRKKGENLQYLKQRDALEKGCALR
jgi:two-component system LytT family response regulator